MKTRLAPKPPQDLYPTDIVFQTAYWGAVKRLLGWSPHAFEIEAGAPRRDMLVVVKPIAPGALAAYVPKGPELTPEPEQYGPFLEVISESVAEQLGSDVAFIRYDLPWESVYAREEARRHWRDRPETRLRELRMNFGTERWNLRKSPVDLTPADSCVVDLHGDAAALLSRMKAKTRYNLRLAQRRGVRVDVATEDRLPTFYALYLETAQRHGFPARDYRYFEALFAAHAPEHPSSEVHLLLATHRGDPVAGAILAISERMAVYLHGASAYHRRELMAPYLMHWTAMQYARARGCRTYDLGAVAPSDDPEHSFHGLHRFKTGFGGRIVHESGSWDYVVDADRYRAFRNWELVLAGQEQEPGIT